MACPGEAHLACLLHDGPALCHQCSVFSFLHGIDIAHPQRGDVHCTCTFHLCPSINVYLLIGPRPAFSTDSD